MAAADIVAMPFPNRSAACLLLASAATGAFADQADYVFTPYNDVGEWRLAYGLGTANARDGSRETQQTLSLGATPSARWSTEAGDWLNAHGMAGETLRWFARLPETIRANVRVQITAAEGYLATYDWNGLEAFLAKCRWDDCEFLRHAMALTDLGIVRRGRPANWRPPAGRRHADCRGNLAPHQPPLAAFCRSLHVYGGCVHYQPDDFRAVSLSTPGAGIPVVRLTAAGQGH